MTLTVDMEGELSDYSSVSWTQLRLNRRY